MGYTRLIIVDNSLSDSAGHHYEYARAVGEEARRRGLAVTIAAHREISGGLGGSLSIVPAFRWRLYDRLLDPARFGLIAKAVNLLASGYFLLRDWSKARLSDLVDGNTIVFVPNCMEFMVPSLSVLFRKHQKGGDPRLVFLFRRDPGSWARNAGKLLRPMVRRGAVMATDSELLAKRYEEATGLPFVVFPMPHMDSGRDRESGNPDGSSLRVAYLGDARMEKGIDVLAEAIGGLENELRDGRVSFVIQCHMVIAEEETKRALGLLKERAQMFPRSVELLEHPLSTEEYYTLLHSCDAVILPYRRREYAARTSGILAEAIAAGKPVIVTEGTWMSEQTSGHGAALTFRDGEGMGLSAAVRQMIMRRDEM